MQVSVSWLRVISAWIVLVCTLIFVVSARASASPDQSSERLISLPPPADAQNGFQVESVRLWLGIWRGRKTGPDGKRLPINSAIVEGEAHYRLNLKSLPPSSIEASDLNPKGVASQQKELKGRRSLVLLNFVDSMTEEPKDLDEIALAGFLDGPFDPGKMELGELRYVDSAGIEHRLGSEHSRSFEKRLVFDLPESARELRIKYRVKVPRRYWPFGCVQQRCSLSGALAPLPASEVPLALAANKDSKEYLVAPARWTIEYLEFANDAGDRKKPSTGVRPFEIVSSLPVGKTENTLYPSIFWGPRWKRSSVIRRGVEVEVLHLNPRPSRRSPNEGLLQTRKDVAGRSLHVGEEVAEVLRHSKVEMQTFEHILVVQGPLRSSVAQGHPEAVILSDRFLDVFSRKRLAKFHEMELARAMLESHIVPRFAQRRSSGRHALYENSWAAESLSAALTQVWAARRAYRDEYAHDIFGAFAFVPNIDLFLYSGQAPFASAYFRSLEEDDVIRNHPLSFSHHRAPGARIHEKLSDILRQDQLQDFYTALAERSNCSARKLAEQSYGHELDWFFAQWLGPYPQTDYSIRNVRSARIETSLGPRWRNEIEVERRGDPVIEPVQVFVAEWGGQAHHLVWNGEAKDKVAQNQARHTFVLETKRKMRVVRVDPRKRFVESAIDLESAPPNPANPKIEGPSMNVVKTRDPRFDNRWPAKARIVFAGGNLSVAASEFRNAQTPAAKLNALSGSLAFVGGLRRDLSKQGGVIVYKDRETLGAVGSWLSLYLGETVRKNRRRARVHLGWTAANLNDRGLDEHGGFRLTQLLGFVDDTRKTVWWPQQGHQLRLGLGLSEVFRSVGGIRDDRYSANLNASWAQLWRLANHHVLATRLAMSWVLPLQKDLEFRSLARGGGLDGLTGYGADELFGRGVALAQLEYRHVFTENLRWNLGNLMWIRGLEGALLGGVGSLSSCDSAQGWFGQDSYYSSVGYALSARTQILGVTPQLLRLELGVPLIRRDTLCLDKHMPDLLAERQGRDASEVDRLLPNYQINFSFFHPF